MRGAPRKGSDIDLGLAVSALSLRYGMTRSLEELAAFCGCARGNLWFIERRALHKLQRAIFMRRDPILSELIESVTGKRLA